MYKLFKLLTVNFNTFYRSLIYPCNSHLFLLALFVSSSLFLNTGIVYGQENQKPVVKSETHEGFYTFYWDSEKGRVYLKLERFDEEFILQVSLSRGVGINDFDLDRGELGPTRLVRFERVGNKVLLHERNTLFRAVSENIREVQAVDDSFASSILWGFNIVEELNSPVIDITDFLISDQYGITGKIQENDEATYTLDKDRSAIFLPRCRSFVNNTEFEATLTFKSDSPGAKIKNVTANPGSISLRQHVSIVKLPDSNYKPRVFHPRSGYWSFSYKDYSAEFDTPITKRFIHRHRLTKKNLGEASSEPVEPIIYYVDPGAPELIRDAIIEGASWWNSAFEAAGFINAFQVKVLPENYDPLDIRYNIINWVHRETRGWSYGYPVFDPRTGEILKGNITLGSQRAKHDYLIAKGLLAPFDSPDSDNSLLTDMALSRIKQLAAHEVGHTLGLAHNFAGSLNRTSVMDYPHPRINLSEEGNISLNNAYDEGIGTWDIHAIRYGYTEFANPVEEKDRLSEIILKADMNDLAFISDPDSRSQGSAHIGAHLWDNGIDLINELDHLYKVRRVALENFSNDVINFDEPVSSMEDVLVPVYLLHRYQLEAVAKLIGGIDYNYSVKDGSLSLNAWLDGKEQKRALNIILKSLTPDFLALDESIIRSIPPRAYGYERTVENFPNYTGVPFDPIGAASSSAQITIALLLQPQRGARLISQGMFREDTLSYSELLDELFKVTIKAGLKNGYPGHIHREVNNLVIEELFRVAVDKDASKEVREKIYLTLYDLNDWIKKSLRKRLDKNYQAHYFYLSRLIENFINGDLKIDELKQQKIPPGSPIG